MSERLERAGVSEQLERAGCERVVTQMWCKRSSKVGAAAVDAGELGPRLVIG